MANTALHIKRIQQEIKEFQTNPADTFYAAPLKDELHIWHFTIKGPTETEFEGGVYHGKIELPFDYPFKPPALYFLNPSGRYEINTKICLTITDYHPEHWNPGWTIKTMMKALISYFPEKESNTGVGALEYPAEERKKLAQQSRKFVCPVCGPIISLVKEDTEEEKKAEESEPKKEQIEEAEIEIEEENDNEKDENGAISQERDSVEIEEEKVESPKKPEIEIPSKKSNLPKQHETYKQIDESKMMDYDFENLENLLLQHIEFYEAIQSINYKKSILETESQQKEKEHNHIKKEQNKKEDVQESILENEGEEKQNEEGDPKTQEKKQINKQITIINFLIIALLLGAILVFLFM